MAENKQYIILISLIHTALRRAHTADPAHFHVHFRNCPGFQPIAVAANFRAKIRIFSFSA